MSRSINKVTILGNMTRDPKIRSTAGGTIVANFSVATNERRKDAQGEWQDYPEYHNLVSFARTAEIVRDYVKKGNKLYVEGKIQTRNWDDKKSGEKKYRTEIIVNELVLLSGKDEANKASFSSTTTASDDTQDVLDDDIPFS